MHASSFLCNLAWHARRFLLSSTCLYIFSSFSFSVASGVCSAIFIYLSFRVPVRGCVSRCSTYNKLFGFLLIPFFSACRLLQYGGNTAKILYCIGAKIINPGFAISDNSAPQDYSSEWCPYNSSALFNDSVPVRGKGENSPLETEKIVGEKWCYFRRLYF